MPDAALPLPLSVLNRLLDTQPGLVARLVGHAGKVAELRLPPLIWRLAITTEGQAAAVPADAVPAVTITLGADVLARLLLGEREALRGARVEGDGGLANDLMTLLDQFDWALALRPLLGDIAAARAAQAIAALGQWRLDARAALDRNLGGWLAQESGLLVDRLDMQHFVAEVDELRDGADRLAARLAVLEARAGETGAP